MAFLYVKAYHGPCTTFHSNIHKPQLLAGLRDRLQKLGFRIDYVPVNIDNYCMLEICGHQVFRCNIQNLRFNTTFNRDQVCGRAIHAVIEASVKFRRARAFLWSWTNLESQLFRSQFAAKDHWVSEANIEEFDYTDCFKCLECCHIRVQRVKDNEE